MKRMSLKKIYRVRDALLTVSENVWHYHAMKKDDQYIVWAEDMEGSSLNANNRKHIQGIQGTVDYFTKQEEDPTADEIQDALSEFQIPFYLSSVQYEEETDYIHYEWTWEVN